MPDPRFYETSAPIDVAEAARIAGATPPPNATGSIVTVSSPDADDLAHALVFVDGRDAAARLEGRAVGLCLASRAFASLEIDGPVAVLDNARLGFALAAARLYVGSR